MRKFSVGDLVISNTEIDGHSVGNIYMIKRLYGNRYRVKNIYNSDNYKSNQSYDWRIRYEDENYFELYE